MANALIAFPMIIPSMVATIALLFLLSSADPGTAVLGAMDGRGMFIPPS
jgi:ABC-type sulfate transport system permease component